MRTILKGFAMAAMVLAAGEAGAAAASDDSAQPTCSSGPYIVFFDWGKADITPAAATILDSAIAAYGDCKNAPVKLAGHTDRSGSDASNMELSTRRDDSVRAYLAAHGIAQGAISSQAFGETMPRVPTADGAREAQNQRVEITFGDGAAS